MVLPLKQISPLYEPMTKSSLRVVVQPPLAVSQALSEQVASSSAQFVGRPNADAGVGVEVGTGVGAPVGAAVGAAVGDTVGAWVSPAFVGEAVGAGEGAVGAGEVAGVGAGEGAGEGARVGMQLVTNVPSATHPEPVAYFQVPPAWLRSKGVLSLE
jgi:hypothetical protein